MSANAFVCGACEQATCITCDGATECDTCHLTLCDECFVGTPFFGNVVHECAARELPSWREQMNGSAERPPAVDQGAT